MFEHEGADAFALLLNSAENGVEFQVPKAPHGEWELAASSDPDQQVAGEVTTLIVRDASFTLLRGAFRGALESVMLALATSALFALIARQWLDLPFGQLWLAYAPGGFEAMAAMALVLKLEPAFVGTHHVLRILGLNLVGPLWLRAPRRAEKGRGG